MATRKAAFFAAQLNRKMRERKLEAADMVKASRGKISHQKFWNWQNAQSMASTEMLMLLADILGCSVDYLLRGGDEEVKD